MGHRAPEYTGWVMMHRRCNSPKSNSYPNYGGRGIKVCPEWASFERFLSDMGPRPSKLHTLDRVDNDGDYCVANCKWSTWEEQVRNKRNTRTLTLDGLTLTHAEWERKLGLTGGTIGWRRRNGWTLEKILSPVKHRSGPPVGTTYRPKV